MDHIREFEINNRAENAKKRFRNNIVHTNKFTPLNFVPMFLLDKFRKFSNIFFLAAAVLEQTGDYTPPGMLPSYIPMLIVYSFSALKDIYEEIKRRISDNTINNSVAWVWKDGKFVKTVWGDVRVGDIIKVERDQLFPADLILIGSSEPEGLAYIETSNLDGESNLKLRMTPTALCGKVTDFAAVNGISGSVKCEHPTANLYKFEGSVAIGGASISLDHNNLLPRGALLRNADWIIGIVTYTGHETRIMMNASKDPVKTTRFEMDVNRHLLIYVASYLTVVTVMAIFNRYCRLYINPNHWYLNPLNIPDNKTLINYLLLSAILFSTMIPISLFITIEFVRLFLGYFIASDLEMYCSETDTHATANSSNLVEELGQIEYVLTDKTGTLTRNEMVMKHLIIDGSMYLNCTDSNSTLRTALSDADNMDPLIDTFLRILSVCHTVMIDSGKSDHSRYQASSPDELAMVMAASSLGYVFESRSMGSLALSVGDARVQFNVCAIIEFTSARKRMSVLVQDSTGKYFLFSKGADNVILSLLHKLEDSSVESAKLANSMVHLEHFASQGLRTLCFAYKEIDLEAAVKWLEKWSVALNTVNDRQRVIDGVAAEIENELLFIGATGVEDCLQEGVADTIQSLYKADINIWMLTGDRFETAISAGFLAGLLDTQTKQLQLLVPEYGEVVKSLEFYLKLTSELASSDAMFALVINGAVFSIIFSDLFTASDMALFKTVVCRCRTLICCRLSPLQKAQITNFVRVQLDKIVLAIGDGGNDVSMIQAANIGIGISGKEGLQASRSADFAIARFKHLKRLLLVHGSWAIYRVSRLVIYAIYKNVLIYVFNFWYSAFNLFSGSTLVDGFVLSDWNLFYTCWSPTVIGMTDQFVCEGELMKNPQLYRFGQHGRFISKRAFWTSVLNAFCQSVIIFAVVYIIFGDSVLMENGHPSSIYTIGNVAFGAILFVAILKGFLMMNYMNFLMAMSLVVGGSIWYMRIYYSHLFGLLCDDAMFSSFKTLTFWASIGLLSVLALGRDYLWKYYLRQHRPLPYHIVQEFQLIPQAEKKIRATAEENQVYSGPGKEPRRTRGFSFSQTYGQSKLLEAYRQSPKLVAKTPLSK